MNRFLINMAIVRVNWDYKGSDILDNYMPLVHETLNHIDGDIFSVDQFKEKFIEIAEFKVPTGAILSLLKKATRKYELLEKQQSSIYKIVRSKLNQYNLSSVRDSEQRRYKSLVFKFIDYCKKKYDITISEENASKYFFEVLYDIAPTLFMNMNSIDNLEIKPSEENKFLVARFVSYSNQYDHESFDVILSFVRGSMLTETFYYSQNPSDISNKPLKRVNVYFDTQFLLRILGFSEKALCIPCLELHEMLLELNVKMRCFKDTFDELHGIFLAALNQMDSNGRLQVKKPSGVFDYINRHGMTPSDLVILLDDLENKLNENKIFVEERPEILEAYSIDEVALSETLSSVFENQGEKARNHDIDCLQAIFQMREGRKQNYLDRCKAIFVTTNSKLAQLSTIFFKDEYGHSNAPVCMADHVFTSLVWMKTVKKTSSLPKDRLVANCYSALMPSDSLWAKYIKEVNRLKDKGSLNEHDYHVLIHSITARDQLMDQAFSSEDNIFGSVEDILDKAKKVYTDELGKRLEEVEISSSKQKNKLETLIRVFGNSVSAVTLYSSLILWVFLLIYGLIFTSPSSLQDLTNITSLSVKSAIFLLLLLITILNLVFGVRLYDSSKSIASKLGQWVSNKLRKILIAT